MSTAQLSRPARASAAPQLHSAAGAASGRRAAPRAPLRVSAAVKVGDVVRA